MTGTRPGTQLLSDALFNTAAGAWSRELRRPVEPDANFFAEGGTSLAATRVVAELRRELGIDISVPMLLQNPTLPAFVETIRGVASAEAARPLVSLPDSAAPPITVQQEAVWFLEQLAPGNSAYNSLTVVDVYGALDAGRLRSALAAVAQRHALLRTSFPIVDGRPVLRRHPTTNLEVDVVRTDDVSAAEFNALVGDLAAQPFSLGEPPLLRCLLSTYRHSSRLALIEHHFLHDGWSLGTLLREIGHAYRTGGCDDELGVTNQYADYAAWQQSWLRSRAAADAAAYWVGLLGAQGEPVRFPRDGSRPPKFTFTGDTVHVRLPVSVLAAARGAARELATTPFVILQAVFAALVGDVTGASEFDLGSMLRNRRVPGTENIIGMFVNTVAVPIRRWRALSLRELVLQLAAMLWEGMEHQELPFPVVARQLVRERDMSRNPLFQVCFSMNDHPSLRPRFDDGLVGTPTYPTNGGAKFDLDVVLVPDDSGCAALWRFYDGVLDRTEVAELVDRYHRLVVVAARDIETHLGDLTRRIAAGSSAPLGAKSP